MVLYHIPLVHDSFFFFHSQGSYRHKDHQCGDSRRMSPGMGDKKKKTQRISIQHSAFIDGPYTPKLHHRKGPKGTGAASTRGRSMSDSVPEELAMVSSWHAHVLLVGLVGLPAVAVAESECEKQARACKQCGSNELWSGKMEKCPCAPDACLVGRNRAL